jgi:hypothetical protein
MSAVPDASNRDAFLLDLAPNDEGDLVSTGYPQTIRGTMGPFTSFALAPSMVSVITGVVRIRPDPRCTDKSGNHRAQAPGQKRHRCR